MQCSSEKSALISEASVVKVCIHTFLVALCIIIFLSMHLCFLEAKSKVMGKTSMEACKPNGNNRSG